MAGVVQEVRAKFSATAQGLMNSIRDMRQGMQGFGDETQDAVQTANSGMGELSDSLEEASDAAEGMADSLHLVGEGADGVGRVHVQIASAADMADRAEKGFAKFRKTFLSWTAAAAGVTLVAGYMGGLVAINDDYTRSLNQVTAATGATADEQAGLGQIMQNIYAANLGQDFNDIAESLGAVKQATGLTGKALEDATKKAIVLRDTLGYEVPESTKVVDTMMKQFGITADQAFELIATGAQQGLDKSGDMLDSFNEYSVYFKQLGFDAEGMWNVFKAGSESGAFNADKVGDAIKELGIRVKDGSKTTEEGFKALGLNADTMAQKFAKGGESAQTALGQTFQALAKIEDPVKRNAAGVALFGTQFEDLEYETIAALGTVRDQADMTGHKLDEMTKVKYNTIGEAIQGIGRQLVVGLINPIQGHVMPVLNMMVNALKDNMPAIQAAMMGVFNTIVGVFEKLAPSIMNAFGILKNVAPAILVPLGIAFQGIMAAIAPVLNYVTDLVQRFTGLKFFAPVLAGIISAFLAYQVGLKAAMAAQKAWSVITQAHIVITNAWRAAVMLLNSAWLANPIVLIIALLVGLGVALYMAYQKSETFREIVNKAWEAIKAGAQAVFNWFTVTLPAWVASVIQWFNQLWDTSKSKASEWGTAISNVWTTVKSKVSEFVTAVGQFFVNLYTSVTSTISTWVTAVVNWFTNLKNMVVNVVMGFVDMIKQYFTNLVNNVKYIIEPFINFFVQSWQNLKDLVLGIIGVFFAIITGDTEALKNALTLIWRTIQKQIQNVITTIKETAIRIFNVLKSGVMNIFNALKTAVIAVWNGLKTAVTTAATALKDGAINAWNALKTGVINAANALKQGAINAWNSLKTGAVSAANGLKDGAISAWNTLKSSVINAVNNIKSGVVNGFNGAKQAAVNAWNGLVSSVKNGVSNAISTVTGMKTSIVNTVKGINLTQIGKNIIQGLVNGLASMLGSLKKKAQEIANTVKNAIADKLKIHSPSRVMRGFGVNVGEGLQIGIGSMVKSVGKVAGGMADAITDNMGVEGALDGALSTTATVTSLQTFKHVIDLLNVPEGIDEASVKNMLLSLFKDKTVQRQIDRVNAENNLGFNRPLGAF